MKSIVEVEINRSQKEAAELYADPLIPAIILKR